MYTNVSFVKIYKGFQENAYRLLFEFSEFFPDKSPTLKCILPSGVIENTKKLKPAPEKAIISYAFSQTISFQNWLKVMCELSKNYNDEHGDPFMWPRTDIGGRIVWPREGKRKREEEDEYQLPEYALVQTWTTNFNDNFKSSFNIAEHNPDESKFSPNAVKEFEQMCVNLFGEEARGRTKFCHKQTTNNNPVFVGTRHQLLSLLMANPHICKDMNILSIFDGGFEAGTVDGKGNTGSKSFNMACDGEYALYIKQGWDTMACATPIEQFMDNRVLY